MARLNLERYFGLLVLALRGAIDVFKTRPESHRGTKIVCPFQTGSAAPFTHSRWHWRAKSRGSVSFDRLSVGSTTSAQLLSSPRGFTGSASTLKPLTIRNPRT